MNELRSGFSVCAEKTNGVHSLTRTATYTFIQANTSNKHKLSCWNEQNLFLYVPMQIFIVKHNKTVDFIICGLSGCPLNACGFLKTWFQPLRTSYGVDSSQGYKEWVNQPTRIKLTPAFWPRVSKEFPAALIYSRISFLRYLTSHNRKLRDFIVSVIWCTSNDGVSSESGALT